MFAVVDWLKPSQRDFCYQNPPSVWYAKRYELAGPAFFLPLQRVYSRFISVEELHDDAKFLLRLPENIFVAFLLFVRKSDAVVSDTFSISYLQL